MAAEIDLVLDLAGEHGVGVLGDVVDAISRPFCGSKVRKFVYIPGRLHTEMTDGFKRNALSEGTHIEFSGLFDDFTGFIAHLDRDSKLGGVIADLNTGVGNEAIVLIILCGDDEETIG